MPALRLRPVFWPFFHSGNKPCEGPGLGRTMFRRLLRIGLMVALGSFCGLAAAQKIPGLHRPFSAIAHITIDHQQPLQAHVYLDRNRQRIDFDSSNPGMAGAYQLTFIPQKKVYLVLPETHRCVPADVSHLPGPARQAVGAELAPAVPKHARTLPDAVIDGQRCQVQEWQEQRDGRSLKIRMWTTRDVRQVPLQMQISSSGGPIMTVHYTDIQTGPPPASLFAIPPECHTPAKP